MLVAASLGYLLKTSARTMLFTYSMQKTEKLPNELPPVETIEEEVFIQPWK